MASAATAGGQGILSSAFVAGKLYVGTNSGVFVSPDNGQHWSSINTGLTGFVVQRIVGNDQLMLLSTKNAGVYRLASDGQSWIASNGGLPQGVVDSFAVLGNTAFLVLRVPGVWTFTYLYRSTNGGQLWVKQSIAASPEYIEIVCAHGSEVYLIGYSHGRLYLFRSTNNGDTWTTASVFPDVFIGPITAMAINDDGVVLVGPWRSEGDLSHWDEISLPYWTAELATHGREFVASGLEVYVSTDGGRTWIRPGVIGEEVSSIAVSSTAIFASTATGLIYSNPHPFPSAVSVSAASYATAVAPNSIVAIFGMQLADSIAVGSSIPPPSSLNGTSISIRDVTGKESAGSLFFVSPLQLNCLIPAALPLGDATFEIYSSTRGLVASGYLNVQRVAPSIFTANSDGKGVPSAYVLQLSTTGAMTTTPVYLFDQAQRKFVPNAVKLSPQADTFFLVLFGTGWRARSSDSGVTVMLNSVSQSLTYSGAAPDFVGLDQMNIRLQKTLKGAYTLTLLVNGINANEVTVAFSQ